MKQGVIILVIIAILAAAGFFFLRSSEEVEKKVDLSPTEVYFAQEIQANSIKRAGQPIEGFEPQMLIQVLPGLRHSDFDGVKSQQGEFQVSNGAMAFVFTDTGPEHSAARAITEDGMATLLKNIALRLGLPFESNEDVDVIIYEIIGPSTDEMLLGLWESTDDEKFTREFESDGTATDRYEGDSLATSVGDWEIFTDLSVEPVDFPETEGATYLKIVYDEEAFYFIILESTEDSLVLTYLDRGNILSFKKIVE